MSLFLCVTNSARNRVASLPDSVRFYAWLLGTCARNGLNSRHRLTRWHGGLAITFFFAGPRRQAGE